MTILLLALTASSWAVFQALSMHRNPAFHGAATWFPFLYVSFVMVGYIQNFIQHRLDLAGPAAQGLTVATLSLLATTAGIALFNAKTGGSVRASVHSASGDRNLLLMAAVILVPAWLYFVLLGSVPIIQGLGAILNEGSQGLGQLQQARLERDPYVNPDARHIPLQGLLELYRNVGTPALFAATLIKWRTNGYRPVYLVLAIASLATVLAAGQRWPLLYLFFTTLFAITIIKGRIPKGILLKLGGLAIIFGAGISILQARTTADSSAGTLGLIGSGVQAVLERAFLGYVETSMISYTLNSPELTGQGGATYLQSLLAYLPGLGESYSVTFFSIVHTSRKGFTAPPDFATEWYINWGFPGVVIGSFIWGAILVRVDRWLAGVPLTAETCGLATILILSMATTATNGLTSVFGFFFIALPVLIVLYQFGEGFKKPWNSEARIPLAK